MKKSISVILVLIMIMSAVPFMSFGATDYIVENAPVIMPESDPVIDGDIAVTDGWSVAAAFDKSTVGYFWAHLALTTSADLYFAYSEKGIYFAGDITERSYVKDYDETNVLTEFRGNGFVYSTGYNDIDIDELGGDDYGWNGDVFSLMIDPMDVLYNSGMTGNDDHTPWYNVGLFKNSDGSETAKVYRTQINDGELTAADGVLAAGKATNRGWTVEAFIPWTVIAKDINDLLFGTDTVTVEELSAIGTTFSAAIMYHDRFLDPEAEVVDTWGRYITVKSTCDDGTPGYMSSGDCIKALGLKLVNTDSSANVNPFVDIQPEKWYTDGVLYCYRNGYMSGISANRFGYKEYMDRQMFATILAKIDGANTAVYNKMSFTDVKPGQWYSNAIEWAYQNGYASGIGNSQFGRKDLVSREQLAVFFYTYSSKNGVNVNNIANLSKYTDIREVHDWAKPAMAWAVKAGIISGTSAKTLSPRDPATRGAVSIIIMNYVRNVK